MQSMRGSVLAASAPTLTAELRAAHAAGTSVYGTPYGTNADGSARTLRRSGALGASLRVEAGAGGLRVVIGATYGRYYPRAGLIPGAAGLPAQWNAQLQRIASREYSIRTGGKR